MAAIVSSGALRFGQCPVAVEPHQLAVGELRSTYSPTHVGGDRVVARTAGRGSASHPRQVGAVVGQERDAREVPGDLRVRAAEAVGQLLAELGPVRVAHDHRRHRARPAEVVAVQRLEQALDVLAREPADVVPVVDVARRRADQDEPLEPLRLLHGGEHADHRADRVADEHHVGQVELTADLEHVVGVALERAVPVAVVGRRSEPPAPTWSKRTIR